MIRDIYFNEKYGRLYESIYKGKLEKFVLDSKYGKIESIYIKRPIDLDDSYYDLITPYGYGGPIIIESNDKDMLLEEYNIQFGKYCKDNKIVSEFIRFHPIFENALDFINIYKVEFSRKTVGTNLKDYSDPVKSEFSKSLRKEIRKSERSGICSKIIKSPNNLDCFKRLYNETMDRNNADKYYYFSDSYFNSIIDDLGDDLIEVQLMYCDEIIASELYFVQGNYIHAHLLGSSQKMLDLRAGGVLEYTVALWGKQNGYHYIHHGGGRTSDEYDSLYMYKKKFGKNTQFDFYTGKKIWNNEIYEYLVKVRENLNSNKTLDDYFPKYRA